MLAHQVQPGESQVVLEPARIMFLLLIKVVMVFLNAGGQKTD